MPPTDQLDSIGFIIDRQATAFRPERIAVESDRSPMSHWNLVSLSEPISPDLPCGHNLEDSGELAMLEAYQIFGQVSLDPAAPEPGAPVPRETRKNKSDRPPNWNELGDLAAGMLTKTRDLRILMHLGAAALWTDGPRPFLQCSGIASKWLTDHWSPGLPRPDEA